MVITNSSTVTRGLRALHLVSTSYTGMRVGEDLVEDIMLGTNNPFSAKVTAIPFPERFHSFLATTAPSTHWSILGSLPRGCISTTSMCISCVEHSTQPCSVVQSPSSSGFLKSLSPLGTIWDNPFLLLSLKQNSRRKTRPYSYMWNNMGVKPWWSGSTSSTMNSGSRFAYSILKATQDLCRVLDQGMWLR